MTRHEKLMLARHLERAARAYDQDRLTSAAPALIEQAASEARTYAALLREGFVDTDVKKLGAL